MTLAAQADFNHDATLDLVTAEVSQHAKLLWCLHPLRRERHAQVEA